MRNIVILFITNACIRNAFRSFAFLQYYYLNLQILAGKYKDSTGFVVRITENRTVILSDLSIYEMEVLPRDLQVYSTTVTNVQDSSEQFQLSDLVQLDAQTVSVQMERKNFHVFSTHGKVVEVRR